MGTDLQVATPHLPTVKKNPNTFVPVTNNILKAVYSQFERGCCFSGKKHTCGLFFYVNGPDPFHTIVKPQIECGGFSICYYDLFVSTICHYTIQKLFLFFPEFLRVMLYKVQTDDFENTVKVQVSQEINTTVITFFVFCLSMFHRRLYIDTCTCRVFPRQCSPIERVHVVDHG